MKELLSNKLIKKSNNECVSLFWNENEFGYNLLYSTIINAIKKRNIMETKHFSMWLNDNLFAAKFLFVFKNREIKKHTVFWRKDCKIIMIPNLINIEYKFVNEKTLKKKFINSIKNIINERNIIQ